MARKPSDVIEDLNAHIDDLTAGFRAELLAMVDGAKARTWARLAGALTAADGWIGRSRANAKILRGVAKILREELRAAGIPMLVEEFGARLGGQFRFFEEMIDLIGASIGRPLRVDWTAADLDLFASQRLTVESGLQTIIDSAGLAAQRRVMFSVGGLGLADLAETLSAGLNAPISEAVNLAETSQAMYFRVMSDEGFKKIEKDIPAGAIRYSYEGPRDKLTRPFCKRMLSHAPMTRVEIERLDNGQLPNPFLTGGGYRCRHQWVIEPIKAR